MKSCICLKSENVNIENEGSQKLKKTLHLPLIFNSNQINKSSSQKHLGIILNETSFKEHLKTVSVKANKTLNLLHKSFSKVCFNYIIQIVYRTLSFIEQPLIYLFMKNLSLSNIMLSLSHNRIRDTSRQKLYTELSFELLQTRR